MSTDVAPRTRAPEVRGSELAMIYRGRSVLDVPEVRLAAGQTYALLGASGAGKSTLLRVLGMLEKPTSGAVTFDGELLRSGSLATRRRIAAVFQKPFLLRGTVGANVEYGLKLRGMSAHERAKRVSAVLERMRMAGWEKRSVLTLSGGETQRIALARALVLEPELLLLDEPLSYMDPMLKRALSLEFAKILANEQLTTLYVTHDQDEAVVVADQIGVMREGRIVAQGDSETVLTLPQDEWVASFLGAQLPFEGVVVASDPAGAVLDCGGVLVRTSAVLASGTRVLCGVRPENVMLFDSIEASPTNPHFNRVSCRPMAVKDGGMLAHVTLDVGPFALESSVPRASARLLDSKSGASVVAVFSATAVLARGIQPGGIRSDGPVAGWRGQPGTRCFLPSQTDPLAVPAASLPSEQS